MAGLTYHQFNITLSGATLRDAITRPTQPLCVTYSLLPPHSLRSGVARTAMPATTAPWAITGGLGGVEAKSSASFLCQAVTALPIATDQSPCQTVLAILFIDALENVLLKEVR